MLISVVHSLFAKTINRLYAWILMKERVTLVITYRSVCLHACLGTAPKTGVGMGDKIDAQFPLLSYNWCSG